MTRNALFAIMLTIGLTGCSAVSNPMSATPDAGKGFDTKLLNLLSQGAQLNGQTNYSPNNQLNVASQTAFANGSNSFIFLPIASPLSGAAAANTNGTTQAQVNVVTQVQAPVQTVL